MENAIVVNQQELTIKEYQGKRVVSLYNIAKLHGTDSDHIRKNFKNNRKYLVEGEDYFVLDKRDDFVTNYIRNEIKPQAFNRIKDVPIFTESGYLMMVKPMTDDLSWQVQRTLVNCYFKVKEQSQPIEEEEEVYLSTGVNFFEEMQENMRKFDEVWSKRKRHLL